MSAFSPLLRRALFGHWNHYTAILPYNLNWSIRLSTEEEQWLDTHPMIVCDVGARGAAPEELLPFYPRMIYHAFDADEAECTRMNAAPHPYKQFHAFPRFVGDRSGTLPFHLYAERGHSSVYQPAERYQRVFGGSSFRIEQTVHVQAVTLDAVHEEQGLASPDFLKLDTQGSELDILRNATGLLRDTHLVEVEVEFLEMYRGQPLFHEVAAFFSDLGFDLLYLNRAIGQRKPVYQGPARGQLIFGDALFGRREDGLQNTSPERLTKYVLLLINYGHIDLAYQLLGMYPEIARAIPSIGRHFKSAIHGSNFKRALISQLDKVALLWLHARRYNQLNMDSDRSWPFR
jgi:FkbM family methyltransferase